MPDFEYNHEGITFRWNELKAETYSVISRLLLVCHCYRDDNDSEIRIISARKATQEERKIYEEVRG